MQGYEFFFGDTTDAAVMAKFMRECAQGHVASLNPRLLTPILSGTTDLPWLIDYYSPLCGHCHHMASLLRRISRSLHGRIHIGTLDCRQHPSACSFVRGFPSLWLYRGTRRVPFSGHHNEQAIIKFVDDVLLSSVVEFSNEDFESLVAQKPGDWFITFSAPSWCGPCREFQSQFIAASRQLPNVSFGFAPCDNEPELCQRFGVTSYPSMLWFKISDNGAAEPQSQRLVGWQSAEGVVEFFYEHSQSSALVKIGARNFDGVVQSDNRPFVMYFGANWCGPCKQLMPTFRQVANRLAQLPGSPIGAGIIDCALNQNFCSQVPNLRHYPMIMVYRGEPGRKRPTIVDGNIWDGEYVFRAIKRMANVHDEL
jgi:thioredoxin-like negative regulator of GroEL